MPVYEVVLCVDNPHAFFRVKADNEDEAIDAALECYEPYSDAEGCCLSDDQTEYSVDIEC